LSEFASAQAHIREFIPANIVWGQILNSPKVTNAQRNTLTNCWLWIANYHKEPRATAAVGLLGSLAVYCGDGKGAPTALSLPDKRCKYQKGRTPIFFAGANRICEISGSGGLGIPQEGNLAANPSEVSRPIKG